MSFPTLSSANLRSLVVRVALLLSSGAVALACSLGGQSTDEADGRCTNTTIEELESDIQVSEHLGFSVHDVLWAFRQEVVQGNWVEVEGTSNNAPDDSVQITANLTRREGAARVVDNGCGTTSLALPAHLELTTDDGLLDEEFTVTLQAQQKGYATTSVEMKLPNFSGSLQVDANHPASKIVQPSFALAINPTTVEGSLSAILETEYSDAVSAQFIEILAFKGDYTCRLEEKELPLVESTEPWKNLPDLGSAWQATTAAGVYSLQISTEQHLCQPAGASTSGGPNTGPYVLATLALTNDEGKTDSRSGALSNTDDSIFSFAAAAENDFSPAEFDALYGNLGLNLNDYYAFQTEFSVFLDSTSEQVQLSIQGLRNDCESVCDANGCSGCPGSTEHHLHTIEFLPVEVNE